jgi:hypothetical protein
MFVLIPLVSIVVLVALIVTPLVVAVIRHEGGVRVERDIRAFEEVPRRSGRSSADRVAA